MKTRFARYGLAALFVHLMALVLFAAPASAQPRERLILAFGDSLTAGYGLGPQESFPAQLQAALRRSGVPARVHNGGVSGDTTAAGRARLGWVLRSLRAKPDLVILELGGNDMLRGLSPAQTRANLEAMIVELKRQRIKVLVAGMLAAPNLGPAYRRQFDPIYPQLARKHATGFYPFFMRGVAGNRRLLLRDGIHPNAAGVGVIVRGMVGPVRAML